MFNTKINYLFCMRHIHMEIDPKRRIGRRFDVKDALLDFFGRHDSTGKEPKTAGIPGCCNEARVCHPTHGRLNNGVTTAK
jgi:hypothetical protein